MSTPLDTVQTIQKALQPYIRPREEAGHIRQVLAAHIQSCVQRESVSSPLALANTACSVAPTPEVRGLQREYLRALSANVKAQREFEAVRKEQVQHTISTTSAATRPLDRLEEHLATVKLQKKRERLQAVEKYLDLLSQQSAGQEGFLDPEEIFKDATPLPEVPRAVVDGFAVKKDIVTTDLKGLVSHLEKSVLRAKLLLQREEQLLEDVKSRSGSLPERISDSARAHALSVTRNELIAWIENELGKASGDGSGASGDSPRKRELGAADKHDMDGKLANIKGKYAQYLAARKNLIQTVTQTPQPAIQQQEETQTTSSAPTQIQAPILHILSPYLESLSSIAHEQKGLITQRSHLNIALAKQLKDTCQILDHLAEESQLLPGYPMPDAARSKPRIGDGFAPPETPDISSRMAKWVFAADSAKIATLEAVAEKVEEGQLALEGSMEFLNELDQLLGTSAQDQNPGRGGADEDIWLAQEQSTSSQGETRRPPMRKGSKSSKDGDVWSILDGNLGLIRSDADPPSI